ncbi:MAG: bacteriocin ABC transporter ATP-binding protein [Blastocatellia bacterium]|nr:MAG: bacteriocin ABC transporter ATP-binding protein [Blastocatellia bacterium]
MLAGIRTHELRKVFTSPPPLAAGGGFGPRRKPKTDKNGSPGKGAPTREIVALNGLSLEVLPGEIFGLLGPNGAGKSTTVGILTTRVRPTNGQAWIGDYDVWAQQVEVKRLIGVVAQRPNLDFSLTAREILLFHGAYFGLDSRARAARASALLDRFKLTDRADQMVRGFSGGMMQRLSIARAMMHDPQVLFLDEPSAGLDPQTRLLLWEIIREYNQGGKTILLTTHNMEEADALCQRLAIIDHGQNIALGTPAELKASVPGGFLLRVRFSKHSTELIERLKTLGGVREVRLIEPEPGDDESSVDVYADRGGSLVSEIANLAAANGVELTDVHISEPSLENLFLHHTGRSLRD